MKYEAIFCIVNSGSSETVMDVAREVGVTGGTVIHARGTASREAEKMFGITVQPEKEIVMIVADSAIRDELLHALYRNVGSKTSHQGIAFALPIEDVVGVGAPKDIAAAQATQLPVDESASEDTPKTE